MTKQISKKCRRLFALLLAVVMMFSVMPMNAIAVTSTNVNEDGYIEIDSIEDLYLINQDLTANYILTADIDMTEATAVGGDWDFMGNGWNPIGSGDVYGNSNAFSGVLDGNGHKIIGMRIDVTTLPTGAGNEIYVGLFANVTGTVKNLTLTGNISYSGNKTFYIGSISGQLSGKIENCVNNASTNGTATYHDVNGYVGGIVGTAEAESTILNSANTGNVTSCSHPGTNMANVADDIYFAGGIAGNGYESVVISHCYNTGDILAKATASSSKSYGKSYAAGIVTTGEISDSYNTGDVFADEYDYETRSYAYGIGDLATRCYNTGKVTGSSANYAVASRTSTNCYYLHSIGASNTGSTALTKGQMKLSAMYEGFDFENVWVLNANAIYPYPQLRDNPQDIRVISNVSITPPTKTLYYKNENLDLTGCTIEFEFENAENEAIAVIADMVTGFDAKKIGDQEVTVTCYDREITFTVNVSELPYKEIRTIEDLYNIRNDLSANYILMNDIDLTEVTAKGGDYDFGGRGWNPIGSNDIYASEAFSGVFDGNGYSIIGMRIEYTSSTKPSGMGNDGYVGLFSKVTGEVRNLSMKNVNIVDAYAYASLYVGAIAGSNNGLITNCSVTGGVVKIKNSNGTYCRAGGIAGDNVDGTISKCYNTTNVELQRYSSYYAGGICAYGGNIENCYNIGAVSSLSSGGICYRAKSVTNCYNMGLTYNHPAIADSTTSIKNSYYSEGATCKGATPLTEAQLKDQSFLVGFDFEEVWISDPYAEYPYPQLRSNPQNLEKKVEEMIWVSEPTDKEYYIGEKINLAGAKVEVVYASGLFEEIEVTEAMVSGFDSSTVGTKTVTVSKGGNSVTFEVEVKEYPTVTNLVLVSGPDKIEFVKDRPVDYTGAVVRATYEDGATADIEVTEAIVTGIDNSTYGTQTATVTVGGKTVTFDIKIIAYRLVGISVEKLPYKTTYIKDDVFNSTGLKVVADYNDGSTKVLQPYQYELTGYSNKVGAQTITVTYYGFSDTFEITVVEKQLANIEITKLPNALDYIQGQELDMTGAVVVATYNNGTTEVITDYNISGFTGNIGVNNVVIASGGVSTTFIVTVREKIVTNIDITSLPTKYGYNAGEALDTTGLVVKAFYNDDSEQEITDYSLVGFSTTPGTHVITVSYAGFTDSFEIFMNEKVLSDFQITTTPSKLTYYLGENLDLSDMVATAYYNNGENYAVTDYEISGFDSQTPGTKVVTIAYGDISRDFAVTVKERVAVVTGGEIKVGSSVARLGDNIIVPISITKNTGLAGFTHTITFDHTRLEYKGVSLGEYYAKGTLIVNTDNVAEGEITVLWFDVKDIAANNIMYNIEFNVRETAADGNAQINISFDENDNGNLEGNNVLFNSVGGNVEVRSYWLGDLNGDREYHMVDLLQLAQYVSGKAMAMTEKQLLSADVNEDTVIDIHDVIMLQQWIIEAGVPEA